jgi:hypothetical protein
MVEEQEILIRLKVIEDNQRANRETLQQINQTLNNIAVQNEKIQTLKEEQHAQWQRISMAENSIVEIKCFQASCPKTSVYWAWCAIGATVLMLGGVFVVHVFNSPRM